MPVTESLHPAAQRTIQDLLARIVESGSERGLQVAAYLDGRLVVDAWAGLADAASGRPVTGETLFSAFSASKAITATVIHLLADRGALSYDDRVARYWPEFGTRGKEGITLRQVLAHTAGVPQMPRGVTPERMADWSGMCAAIAELEPLWVPGTETGYHALTFGWILGEVARRIDGRPFERIVQEAIARPLGIEDLYMGLPADREARVATLESGPVPRTPVSPDALILQAIPIAVTPSPRVFNRHDVREASIPAAGGIMTARALARMYAGLIGEVDGARLFGPERVRLATELQTDAMDLVLLEPIRKGLGYFLGDANSPMGEHPLAFGHPGAGGAIGFADPRHGLSFALVKNRLVWGSHGSPETALAVGRALRAALDIPETTWWD